MKTEDAIRETMSDLNKPKQIRVFRAFLNLMPPQFVDIIVPYDCVFLMQINLWRNQEFAMVTNIQGTEGQFLEWKYVIAIRDMWVDEANPVAQLKAEPVVREKMN